MQKIEILGVKICAITMQKCLEEIKSLLKDGKQHFFVTPNPEIILKAQEDQEYKKILNNADLQTADGSGLLWAARLKGRKLPERVTGVELMQEICKLSPSIEGKIFLLGAKEGVAEQVKKKLKSEISGIQIVGTSPNSPDQTEKSIKMINNSKANILFVAYGAPKQEKWIAQNLSKIPNIKLAGGIGGAFDFIAKKRKRAPKWMQKLHIEWLFRLIQEPKRWKRIYNAVFKFPLTVLTQEIFKRKKKP